MKRNFLLPAGVALLSFLAGGLAYFLFQDGDDAPGKTPRYELNSIPLADLDGRQTLLGDWRSDILVVNFWAPWCAPCRREIPALIEIQREFEARGVRIIGIAFDNPEQVRRFADEYRMDYPLFIAGNRSTMYNAAFGNTSGSLPFTALLDRDLRVLFRHNGEMTRDSLRQQLQSAR